MALETKYNHLEVEKDKNQKWIDKGFFSKRAERDKPYSIILPPPNVTGKLHLGHAWDGYIQDTLIRFKKLQGFDVLFVPGLDHAGIATQAKVEEKLRKEFNLTRYDLGREKFLEKVWEWKEEYASTIRSQWGKLGLALDYTKERFTMDQGLSEAVTKVFIKMYEDKLIYRGTRPVNWDTSLQTVLSNIEVIPTETKSVMYYFNYELSDGGSIQVATTRPETMFSDVAIAVNPKDEVMSKFIGKTAISPLTGKKLPIIGDSYIEIGKGTGAMKVSAHAEADIAIIKSNNLEIIECIDKKGLMNSLAGDLEGIDRFEARKLVVAKLASSIFKQEEITNNVGRSERSGVVVETLVQPQWFVNMQPLADKLIKDLDSSHGVTFYPERFEDVIRGWMGEIQDWCISRQLWWGHRIPAWYKGEEIKVQVECPGEGWVQDEDVLDTWFSSGLAPFSFLGWPNAEELLKKFYPTSVLVTGYDIIFFWVARMYFQGLEFMGQKPFDRVLIHGLIRAEDGRKMSKSLGNGIDPMDVIEKYGSDALRYFVMTNSTPGQDLRYSEQKIESAWALNNKLWNISRYILDIMPDESVNTTDADKWIVSKLNSLSALVTEKMETYDFTIIGKEITKFIMEDFSSWYIEFTKATPNKKVAKDILKKLLIIIHPFMPFVSDHLYNLIDGEELLEQKWPVSETSDSATYIDRVILVTKAIRNFRTEKNMSHSIELKYYPTTELSNEEKAMITKLTNATIEKNEDALVALGEINIYIQLSDELKASEKERINKEISFLKAEITRAENMLSNERFVSKAPEAKINEEKEKLANFKLRLSDLQGGN